MHGKSLAVTLLLSVSVITTVAKAQSMKTAKAEATSWVGSWAASQQLPEPQNSLPPELLNDATLRQIVHLSVGGSSLRVHISNAFGFLPLHLTSVHIARPLSPSTAKIDTATDKPLTFSGNVD